MSTYEDLKINIFLGEASVYEVWPAKPPANLTFTALTPVPVVCYATEGIASNLMDIKDQAYLLRAGIFCDFADGIIKMNDGIFTLRVGAGESTVTPAFSLGSRDYRIPALNTMFEINETIGNLTTKRIAEIGGATNYVIQAKITADQAGVTYPVLSTVQVNPALADIGGGAAGEAFFRMDVVLEVKHSYNFI